MINDRTEWYQSIALIIYIYHSIGGMINNNLIVVGNWLCSKQRVCFCRFLNVLCIINTCMPLLYIVFQVTISRDDSDEIQWRKNIMYVSFDIIVKNYYFYNWDVIGIQSDRILVANSRYALLAPVFRSMFFPLLAYNLP